MQRKLHILLALVVIACPLSCIVLECNVGCCDGVEAATAVAECDCCPETDPADADAPLPPDPEQSCQCFCGGAILADAWQMDGDERECEWDTPWAMPAGWQLATATRGAADPFPLAVPDVSRPAGRMLRHLHMSLLL